jgi:hypothetical protein
MSKQGFLNVAIEAARGLKKKIYPRRRGEEGREGKGR